MREKSENHYKTIVTVHLRDGGVLGEVSGRGNGEDGADIRAVFGIMIRAYMLCYRSKC